jgi:hypothetical protein
MPTKKGTKQSPEHIAKRRAKAKLADLVVAARAAGVHVSVSLEPKQMPQRFGDDPQDVRLLLGESERVAKLANNWLAADTPNPYAAETAHRQAWAYALAGAWLRCKLKGEVK